VIFYKTCHTNRNWEQNEEQSSPYTVNAKYALV